MPVEFLGGLGFTGEVEGFLGGGLHAGGEFVAGDPGLQIGFAGMGCEVFAVEAGQEVEVLLLQGALEVGRRVEVEDAGFGGAHHGALKERGHEPVGPVADAIDGMSSGVGEDNVGREILAFVAEAVGEPGTEGGAARLGAPGVHEPDRRLVPVDVGVHRTDDGDVVHDAGEMGKQFGDGNAGLTMALELPWASEQLFAGAINKAEGDVPRVILT